MEIERGELIDVIKECIAEYVMKTEGNYIIASQELTDSINEVIDRHTL